MSLFHKEILLLTLGAGTAIITNLRQDTARLQGTMIHKMQYVAGIRDKTGNEGPLIFGFSRAGVSITEIAAFFAADPQSEMDTPSIDEARVDVYPVGVIMPDVTESPGPAANSGPQGFRTVNWPWKKLAHGADGLNFFVFNRGPAALTTGSEFNIVAKIVEEFLHD